MFQHNFPYDPTYGYSESQMRQIVPPEPVADFESFWRGKFDRAMQIDTRVEETDDNTFNRPDLRITQISFDAMGLNGAKPVRLGGWLIRPAQVPPTGLMVIGHGYGGREAPDLSANKDSTIRLFVCKRGFHRSVQPDLPVNSSGAHVVSGIESRETYVHLGNAADIWASVKVLHEMYPDLRHRLDYSGGSFGGGIGALAMPWDNRVRRVFLDVPSFGNHPLRLQMQCGGSGEAVRKRFLAGQPVEQVLQYFDSAVAARFMDKPTLVGCARFDPAVPPPGQFSVYNAIPCAKKLVVRDGGHFEYPELARQQVHLRNEAAEWFAQD